MPSTISNALSKATGIPVSTIEKHEAGPVTPTSSQTPSYTTPTSTTSPVTEALSKASGVPVSTIEKHEAGPVTPVVKEPAQVFTIPETKATIEIKTTPFLTPTERLLIETGFAKAPASILPGTSTERRLVYERTQEVTGPYTTIGARQVAIQQLERENVLAEGYGGITTIRKTPTITSTGYEKYGYQPNQQVYYDLIGAENFSGSYESSVMGKSESILQSNIEASKQAGASLSTTQKYLTEGRASLDNIRNAPESATIYITELDESGKEKEVGYTKSEAIKIYEDYLSGLESSYTSNKELAGRQTEFENELKRLGAEETTLQAYQQAGYKAIINEKGELILSTPKASEVVTGIYGNRPDLYTAESMRSLGLQTVGSAIQFAITGDESVRQAEKERLAEGILGSTKQVGESNLEFTGRFWSSPETIMDVYVPIITFGAGAAISIGGKALAGTRIGGAIVQSASKSSTLVTVGRALSSTAGQVAVVGGIVTVQEAPIVIETAINRPEMLGSTIGRATYDVGMNLTSFIVGAEYGARAYDVLAPSMRQGYTKVTNLMREEAPGLYSNTIVRAERIQYKIGEFKAKGITANEELYGRVSGVVETARVPTVTVSSRGIKYDLKSPGELKNVMTYEGERLPTVKKEPTAIRTFSQEAGGKRITYDVQTGGYTIEQVHPVASTRPFTKEATEFKPPENKPRTAYEIKTEQEPLNVNLQEKYNLQGKTTQQKIEYYGKGKTYLVAKEEDYFLKPGDVTATELERVQSLKGTRPLRYGETKIVERQPSPDLLEKFKTTKEDIARYDLQTEQAGKKLVEWKPKGTSELKQYEVQGDTVVRVGGGSKAMTKQMKILEANEDLFAYGTAKPTPQAKSFDVEFKPPENRPMSIEDVYSKISETSKKEFINRGTPKLKQETLEIVPEKPGFIKEGTVAGINKGIKPGSTPLKFTKPEEFKISEKTIKPSGGTITIQETAPSKFREGSLYKGIESVNRPLTSEEITILRSAEEATYTDRYIPKIVRVGGISTLGSTEKIIHGELSTQKPMQIKMKDIGLGLRTRVAEQQTVGEIGKMRIGQMQEGKYESEQAQKLSSRLAFDVKQDVGVSTKQEQVQLQRQAQRQVQLQAQTTEQKIRFTTPREVITKKKIRVIPPYIPKEELGGGRRSKKEGKRRLKFTSKPSKQDKGLLADWLSVTQSQARYGTATHPKLTAGTWEEARQSGYMKVPTEELKRGGIRRNIFGNKRGNKNVFK